MADGLRSTQADTVVGRDEWSYFISEVKKLVKAYEQLLGKTSQAGTSSRPGKSSILSSILSLARARGSAEGRSPLAAERSCPSCGSDLSLADKFCRICGNSTQTRPALPKHVDSTPQQHDSILNEVKERRRTIERAELEAFLEENDELVQKCETLLHRITEEKQKNRTLNEKLKATEVSSREAAQMLRSIEEQIEAKAKREAEITRERTRTRRENIDRIFREIENAGVGQ